MAISANCPIAFAGKTNDTLCYLRVARINANKSIAYATVEFLTEDAEHLIKTEEFILPVCCNQQSSNFIAQAYEHLKTLPEFADAVDC